MRQVQEELYQRLLKIREGLATSLTSTLTEVDSAPVAEVTNAAAGANAGGEADELRAENKKL